MSDLFRRFMRAPSLYPAALSYTAAVTVIVAISAGWLRVGYGIAVLGFAAVLIVLLSMRRELDAVHGLVNHRSDEQLRRIDQLTAALVRGDVDVPADPAIPETTAAGGVIESD